MEDNSPEPRQSIFTLNTLWSSPYHPYAGSIEKLAGHLAPKALISSALPPVQQTSDISMSQQVPGLLSLT